VPNKIREERWRGDERREGMEEEEEEEEEM
jgi:hypothetical protein